MSEPHRILIIDDNRAIHEDFRKILCPTAPSMTDHDEAAFFGEAIPAVVRARFEIESAFQGLEGCARLERALAEGRPPAVAFLDVRMPPGIDGVETARRLWQMEPDLQIVICTAYSDYSWEQMVDQLGHPDRLLVLKKPFAAIEALQLTCALSEKWSLARNAREHLAETERIVAERTRELTEANQQLAAEMSRREAAEHHLLRAQRMESIGTLAGGIAHDLNNLLSPILVSAELLHGDLPAATREELACTIETSVERAAGIVRQVLTFARGIEGERVPLQPKQLVREISKIIGETFPRNIMLECDPAADLWLIEGDATQIHQILMNLCVNARDAMPYGGTLLLAAENFECTASHVGSVAGASPGRYVKLTVADTGTGMPPDVMEKAFDPFFTTKPIGKGTGLGLSTVAGIVKSHRGFVDLQSQPGKGTTFEVLLPAVHDDVPAAGVIEEGAAVGGNGELILVVDDEPQIREVIETALTARGYRVITAADGAEALTQYVAAQAEICAVVTDLAMPLVDGVALCRALRRIDPAVCVIATSGTADEARAQEVRALNVRTVLHKPFHASVLLTALHQAMGRGRVAMPARAAAGASGKFLG